MNVSDPVMNQDCTSKMNTFLCSAHQGAYFTKHACFAELLRSNMQAQTNATQTTPRFQGERKEVKCLEHWMSCKGFLLEAEHFHSPPQWEFSALAAVELGRQFWKGSNSSWWIGRPRRESIYRYLQWLWAAVGCCGLLCIRRCQLSWPRDRLQHWICSELTSRTVPTSRWNVNWCQLLFCL